MKAWEDVSRDRLSFPIGGKTYTIPELPYQAMIVLEKAKAGEPTYLDDAAPEETWRLVMGHVYDDMCNDNVPVEALNRAALASLAFWQFGREIAESMWETGIDPKAMMAALMAGETPPEALTPSRSTGAAKSTRTASTSGTTSRKATPRARAAKKATPAKTTS